MSLIFLYSNLLIFESSYIRTKVYQDSPYNIEMGFRGLSLFFLIIVLVYNHSLLFEVTPNTRTNLGLTSGTGKTYGGWPCCCRRMRESDIKRPASLPSSFLYLNKISVRECWLTPHSSPLLAIVPSNRMMVVVLECDRKNKRLSCGKPYLQRARFVPYN